MDLLAPAQDLHLIFTELNKIVCFLRLFEKDIRTRPTTFVSLLQKRRFSHPVPVIRLDFATLNPLHQKNWRLKTLVSHRLLLYLLDPPVLSPFPTDHQILLVPWLTLFRLEKILFLSRTSVKMVPVLSLLRDRVNPLVRNWVLASEISIKQMRRRLNQVWWELLVEGLNRCLWFLFDRRRWNLSHYWLVIPHWSIFYSFLLLNHWTFLSSLSLLYFLPLFNPLPSLRLTIRSTIPLVPNPQKIRTTLQLTYCLLPHLYQPLHLGWTLLNRRLIKITTHPLTQFPPQSLVVQLREVHPRTRSAKRSLKRKYLMDLKFPKKCYPCCPLFFLLNRKSTILVTKMIVHLPHQKRKSLSPCNIVQIEITRTATIKKYIFLPRMPMQIHIHLQLPSHTLLPYHLLELVYLRMVLLRFTNVLFSYSFSN